MRTRTWLALALLFFVTSCQRGAPELSFTPQALDFGVVAVGSAAQPLRIELSNVGTAAVGSVTLLAPEDPAFVATTDCVAPWAPGVTCAVEVTFEPTVTALFESIVRLQTQAGLVEVALRGSGVASFSVSPLELDFGEVGVGATSAVQTVTIRNHGTTTLAGFAGGAPFDPQFGAGQNCAAGVPPGGSCQYSFTFSPTAEGDAVSTSATSTGAGPFEVRLRGRGVGPRLWVTPTSLDFGPLLVGAASPTQTVVVTNLGRAILAGFAGGAPFDTQFKGAQNCAGGVAPGASCEYTFRFEPEAAGAAATTSNSSSNAGAFVIDLLGTGVTAPPTGPAVVASPLAIDFGDVPVGQTSAVRAVTIRNPGDATLAGFVGGGSTDPQFSVSQNCVAGVPPGGSCQYFFTFTPAAEGVSSMTSSSESNAGPFVIVVRGTGVGPRLWVTPLELDFGTVPVGVQSAPQTVTITNVGATTLGAFVGGGPRDPQFTALQSCAGGVAPGASCTYTFRFTPAAPGVFESTSETGTNAGGYVVKLRGNTPAP